MLDFLQYGDKRIEFNVVIKKRKTIGLSISLKDGLRVSAPKWVSKKQIRSIVEQKAEWILKRLSEFAKMPDSITLGTGAELLFLGLSHRLEIIDNEKLKRANVSKLDDMIIMNLPLNLALIVQEEQIRNNLIFWYKKQAEILFNQRINIFSEVMQLSPSRITIKQQKTRWGSCSSKGNLNINWKLIMMPISVIDYVLIHELAHLKHPNHSINFWQYVESFLPDYKDRELLLKEYGRKINFP